MINIKQHKELIQSILYLHKENIINKSFKENELKELILKLNLRNETRKELISINNLLYCLEQLGIEYHTHKYISFNNSMEEEQEIIYRFNDCSLINERK